MRDYRSDNNRGSFRDRNSRGATMNDAICDECGRKCKVPFKPTGDKPVYCSDCFEHKSERGSGRSDSRRQDYSDRRMYTATCDKCGNRCEVPFQPTSGKPVYCSDCFEKTDDRRGSRGESDRGSDSRGGDNKQLQEQVGAMNRKLDRIEKVLALLVPGNKEAKKEISGKDSVSAEKKAKNVAPIKAKVKAKKTEKKKAPKAVKKTTKSKKTKAKTKPKAKVKK